MLMLLASSSLTSACTLVRVPPKYSATIHRLTVKPVVRERSLSDGRTMTTIELGAGDFDALYLQLQTACLMFGGTDEECDTEEDD